MTVPLHTARQFLGTVTGAGPTTLYTVPAGYRAVVKTIRVVNSTGAGQFIRIQVGSSGPRLVAVTVPAQSGTAGSYQLDTFVVLEAGETLVYAGNSGNSLSVSIAGYLYPLSL